MHNPESEHLYGLSLGHPIEFKHSFSEGAHVPSLQRIGKFGGHVFILGQYDSFS